MRRVIRVNKKRGDFKNWGVRVSEKGSTVAWQDDAEALQPAPQTLCPHLHKGVLCEVVVAAVVRLAVVEGDDALGAAAGVQVMCERKCGVAGGRLLAAHQVVAVACGGGGGGGGTG